MNEDEITDQLYDQSQKPKYSDKKGCGQCLEGWRFIRKVDSGGRGYDAVTRCSCHPAYRGDRQ